MGRNSTGSYTTDECKRIEISYLIKNGYLLKGMKNNASLGWTNSKSTISITACYKDDEKYIELNYSSTNKTDSSKKEFRYKIYIEAVPSNLGNGEVLYFICPETGKRCRILYNAYNCDIWKSRFAYQNRIYYSLQQCSKLDRYNTRYWILERKLLKRPRKRVNGTYRGKKSKTSIKNEKMWNEFERMDQLRWSIAAMPKSIHKYAKEMEY